MRDLNEQAQAALEAALEQQNLTLPYVSQSIARQLWLVGYKAGMDATKAMADEAFATLERSL